MKSNYNATCPNCRCPIPVKYEEEFIDTDNLEKTWCFDFEGLKQEKEFKCYDSASESGNEDDNREDSENDASKSDASESEADSSKSEDDGSESEDDDGESENYGSEDDDN